MNATTVAPVSLQDLLTSGVQMTVLYMVFHHMSSNYYPDFLPPRAIPISRLGAERR